jgi:hypothetical protein
MLIIVLLLPGSDKLQRRKDEPNNNMADDHGCKVGADAIQVYQWNGVIVQIEGVVECRLQCGLSKQMQHLVKPVSPLTCRKRSNRAHVSLSMVDPVKLCVASLLPLITFPWSEVSLCRMFGKSGDRAPNTTAQGRQLEGGSRLFVIHIGADQISRLIKLLALVEDGCTRVQTNGTRTGRRDAVSAATALAAVISRIACWSTSVVVVFFFLFFFLCASKLFITSLLIISLLLVRLDTFISNIFHLLMVIILL